MILLQILLTILIAASVLIGYVVTGFFVSGLVFKLAFGGGMRVGDPVFTWALALWPITLICGILALPFRIAIKMGVWNLVDSFVGWVEETSEETRERKAKKRLEIKA